MINQYLDMCGFPVERPKNRYPYSYSPFRIYKRNWSSNDLSVDSDRLFEWDSEKYDRLSEEVFGNTGQYFFRRYPEEIQLFLQRYFNRRILITGIMECCNASNGYPYWTFYYKDYGPLKKENQNGRISEEENAGS